MNKNMRWFWLGGSVLALALIGSIVLVCWNNAGRLDAALPAEEQQILGKGESFILYSLDPNPEIDPKTLIGKPNFHGHLILGQTQIKSDATRKELLKALYEAAGNGLAASCFNPRHGIRAVQGKKTVDLVICFQCGQLEVNDEHGQRMTTLGNSPQPVFDLVLTQNDIPLTDR